MGSSRRAPGRAPLLPLASLPAGGPQQSWPQCGIPSPGVVSSPGSDSPSGGSPRPRAPPPSCLPQPRPRPPLKLATELLLPLQDGHVQLAPLLLHVQRVVAGGHLKLACLHRTLWAGPELRGVGAEPPRAPQPTHPGTAPVLTAQPRGPALPAEEGLTPTSTAPAPPVQDTPSPPGTGRCPWSGSCPPPWPEAPSP